MTKIKKNLPRLQELQNSVLESIYNHCVGALDSDSEITSIENEAEIIHNNEYIGNVKFYVLVHVLSKAFEGDYDYPPTAEEVDFELCSTSIEVLYSQNGLPLPNITKSINDLIYKKEGKILKF